MTVNTPFEVVEEGERRARIRRAADRAKAYGRAGLSRVGVEPRLHDLERRTRGAAARVRHARRGS